MGNINKIIEQQKPKKVEKSAESKEKIDPVSAALNAIENTQYESITKFGWD